MTFQLLCDKLNLLSNGNPDIPVSELRFIYSLAEQSDSTHFASIQALTCSLIQGYLESPPKQSARTLFKEYAICLERSARLLADSGKIPASETSMLIKSNQTMALLPINISDSLLWCNIISNAEVPKPLKNAIQACQMRNEHVNSVIEIAFAVLAIIDEQQTTNFFLDYIKNHELDPDFDIIRDMLHTWLKMSVLLPPQVLEYCKAWSLNTSLREIWPYVAVLADQLIRKQHILKLSQCSPLRFQPLAELQFIGKHYEQAEYRLVQWQESALEQLGKSIAYFSSLAQKPELNDFDKRSLHAELKFVEQLFPALMLCADISYNQPNGLRLFSLAFFGFSGQNLAQWRDNLLKKAEVALTRLSWLYMRENRSMEDFIERFTFGNRVECQRLQNKLDLATGDFPNLKMRNYIIGILSSFYAGSRELSLLSSEIAKCYRNWRRLLHEDFLRNCLRPEDFAYWQQSDFLQKMNAFCSEIRRYLDKQRSSTATIEEIYAAEMDLFCKIRELRIEQLDALEQQISQANTL